MTLIAHADVHELPADTQLVHVASTACICEPALDPARRDVWIHRPLDSPHPVPSPLAGTEW